MRIKGQVIRQIIDQVQHTLHAQGFKKINYIKGNYEQDTRHKKWKRKGQYLMGIPGKSDRPVVIIFKGNMPQLRVGYIFYDMPFHLEETTPLVNLPEVHVFIKIYRSSHLS